jgi:hypothetical protein
MIPLFIVSSLFVLFPVSTKMRSLWICFFVSLLFLYSDKIFSLDNHKWLFLYWVIGILLTFQLEKEEVLEHLSKTACWLIIVSFTLALFWKFYGGEYLNYKLFEFNLAGGDPRFQDFIRLVAGYSFEEAKMNSYLAKEYLLPEGIPAAYPSAFVVKPGLILWAKFLSYYTLLIELLIPTLFLLAIKFEKIRKYASYSLVIFIVTVYLIVPVSGFGALLAILGFSYAKSANEERAFILSFFFILLVRFPFSYFSLY